MCWALRRLVFGLQYSAATPMRFIRVRARQWPTSWSWSRQILREQGKCRFEPALHVVEQRRRPLLARAAPFVGRLAANLLFDLVERADPAQRLLRHGVGAHRMQVVDLPARVGHTRGLLDAAVEIQLGIASERVGLQYAREVYEMLLRMAVTNHAEVRPYVLELLRDVFAQRLETPAAIRAVVIGRQMDALLVLKVTRQRLAARTVATRLFRFVSGRHFGGLQVLRPQFELLDLKRARRELLPQLGDLSVALTQQRFQSVDVVGKRGRSHQACIQRITRQKLLAVTILCTANRLRVYPNCAALVSPIKLYSY